VHRAGEVTLLPLVGLADVDPDGAVEVLGATRVDLVDRRLRLLEQLAIRGHDYSNGSVDPGISSYLRGKWRPPTVSG
jgi:hypothetical protein